jgi:hypothetical protein
MKIKRDKTLFFSLERNKNKERKERIVRKEEK